MIEDNSESVNQSDAHSLVGIRHPNRGVSPIASARLLDARLKIIVHVRIVYHVMGTKGHSGRSHMGLLHNWEHALRIALPWARHTRKYEKSTLMQYGSF